jgi:hypothetical protein
VVLDQSLKFVEDVLRGAILDTLLHTAVGSDNVTELVSQIVLSAHALACTVDGDTRPHWRRGHCKHCHDHPLGAGIVGVEAEQRQGVVGEKLEDVERVLRGNDLLALALAVVVFLLLRLVRGSQLETFLADGVGLVVAAAAVSDLWLLLGIFLADVLLARLPATC